MLSASNVVAGCVTENNTKYLGQTLRLVQSVRWFGGELANARFVVAVVETIGSSARRALEALGVEVRIVPRFHPRNGSSNRLQWFAEVWDGPEEVLFSLDCDTIVVQDPLPLLPDDAFFAKVAPAPTVTHEVFERLFREFGMKLPQRTHVTGYTGTPTIPYFNAGVISIPASLARTLVPSWMKFNTILADRPELAQPCAVHVHQAALSLALAETRIPVKEAPQSMNYQLNMTHLPTPASYTQIDPIIVHYHHLVDERGLLRPCPFPRAQERVDAFNARLTAERSLLPRRQIAVLGMHRSGTSVVAQLIAAMGAYAGEDAKLPKGDAFNPSGYWEHRDVVALNEEILRSLDASWGAPLQIPQTPPSPAFVERARTIAQTLAAHGTSVLKDPRMSILFPYWRDALDNPACVLVWREPAAVARSLESRDDIPLPAGLALWEEYTRAMLVATRGVPRVLVSYEELVADPIRFAARLHEFFGVGTLPTDDEVRAIVDPKLDRHSRDDSVLTTAQLRLRDGLRSGEVLQWDDVTLSRESRDVLVVYAKLFRWQAEVQRLDSLLEDVFTSRSWRVGRTIAGVFRKIKPKAGISAEERWRNRV